PAGLRECRHRDQQKEDGELRGSHCSQHTRYDRHVTVPVRSGQARDDIDGLRARLSELEKAYGERDSEIARAMTDLAAFRIRYRREVGRLHDELEDLERAIAEAELGEFAQRLEDEGAAASELAAAPPPDSAPRLTSDAVRKLFRDVAKMI